MKPAPGDTATNWFKITWPVISLVIVLALAGIGAFNKMQVEMAVVQTNYTHINKELSEIKADVKKILSNNQ